ncbi:hypothetical protein [Candidatus Phytoplasma fraxini]|uniref:Uncharacterized protein n=1 Tax=Ash yellows phytoplasma TaxID=35780 RepID=A0ABZ2U827_ASHYP
MNDFHFTLGFLFGATFTIILMFIMKKLFFPDSSLITKKLEVADKEMMKPKPIKNLKTELKKDGEKENGKMTDAKILETEMNT